MDREYGGGDAVFNTAQSPRPAAVVKDGISGGVIAEVGKRSDVEHSWRGLWSMACR